MKQRTPAVRVLLVCLFVLLAGRDTIAQSYYDIVPVNGHYVFNYNQVPEDLVPLNPNISPGIEVIWEESDSPTSGFTTIAGTDWMGSYSFAAFGQRKLDHTMYFRRKLIWHGDPGLQDQIPPYSNTVKITIVSVNWENINYLREHDVKVPGQSDWKAIDQLPIGQKLQTTTYLDGLGRSVERIGREMATPDPAQPNLWGDIVQFSVYDAFGRQPAQYLPYTTTVDPGKYKSTPLTGQSQYYSNTFNEAPAFSTATYDNSPLNRVTNKKAPGAAWAASAGNSVSYELNTVSDNVQMFSIGYNTGDVPVSMGAYPANTLFKKVYTEARTANPGETGKHIVEYVNSIGKLILKKVQIDDNPSAGHTGWICTYSVYDDFGLLRYQIQPEAVKWLEANGWSFAGTDGQTVLNEQCFRYEYDERGRNILKKVPGAKEVYMIYNNRDRVVFSQDGNQRTKTPGEWLVTLYDELDRTVSTGLYNTTKTMSALQTDAVNSITIVPPPANLVVNSRNTGIATYVAGNSIEFDDGFESVVNDEFEAEISPMATTTVYASPVAPADMNDPSKYTPLRYNYYDDYSYSAPRSFDNSFTNALAYAPDPTVEPITQTSRTTSMITGTRVRILGTNNFLLSSLYYDEEGRLTQTVEENIKSGVDITTNQYSFDDRLLSTDVKHTAGGTIYTGYDVLTKMVYNRLGAVTSLQKKFGANGFKTVAAYDFNDLGMLKTKHLDPGYTGSGKNELESLGYTYNINGMTTGINKDYALKTPGKYDKWGNFFGLYLGYDNQDGVFAGQSLDGHISGTLWSTQGDDVQRKYDFTYDNSGRLVNALFNERQTTTDSWSNGKMDFSVTGTNGKIEYDLNGNLLSMLQKGILPGTTTPVTVDDLRYEYTSFSNRVKKITDNGNLGAINGKLGDFADGNNGSNDDYVFDDNGNLVTDLNKNVTALGGVAGANGISYNFLDKPEMIHIAGKGTIKLVYDADGNKLQKLYTPEGSSVTSTTTYINSFVYQGDDLQFIGFEEGRIRPILAVTPPDPNALDVLSLDGNMDLPGGKRGVYDFYIRDYEGNVRMILTEEIHIGRNTCTMEAARASNEEPLFGQVDAAGTPTADNEVKARFATSGIPGQSSNGGWQDNTSAYVSRVGNLAAKKVGPNVILKVMAGDQVNASTLYYYANAVTNQSGGASLLTDLLVSLGQTISGSGATSALLHGGTPAANITGQLGSSIPFASAADPDATNTSGSNPKAYLSVLFFDERFNFISEGSTALRVSTAGNGAAPLVLTGIKAPKNGYAYVYVSNESDEMVYFDNLQVALERGRIIEEDHYYAYGLKIAGISSRKLPDANDVFIANKYLYNGHELMDEADLNWSDYGFRSYDPQTGRFQQIDPLTDNYPDFSSYHYAACDPIGNIDEDGLDPLPVPIIFKQLGDVMASSSGTVASAGASAAANFIGSGLRITLNLVNVSLTATSAVLNASVVARNAGSGGGPGPKRERPMPQKTGLFVRYAGTNYKPLGGDVKSFHNSDDNYRRLWPFGTGTLDEPAANLELGWLLPSYDFGNWEVGAVWYHMKPDDVGNVYLANGYTLGGLFVGRNQLLNPYWGSLKVSVGATIAGGPMFSKPQVSDGINGTVVGYVKDGCYRNVGWGVSMGVNLSVKIWRGFSAFTSYNIHASQTKSLEVVSPTDPNIKGPGVVHVIAGTSMVGIKFFVKL